jgi:hypothetical protein
VDLGLIGTFALYHQPLAATTAAVLVYHAIALWVPGLLGSVAFVQLRRSLQRQSRPAAILRPVGRAARRLTSEAVRRSPPCRILAEQRPSPHRPSHELGLRITRIRRGPLTCPRAILRLCDSARSQPSMEVCR